ncbi:MAG TPA: hypothetical protein PL105_19170 [Caldilineaceae bacterium]|nr:hypothetical protein [Caldilineaceae bacterium]
MSESIRQRVLAHDRFQVELRHSYRLQPDRKSQYRITTYIFLPQSLGVDGSVYSPQEFYRRVQNYVRLRTPAFTLQALCRESRSPLLQLRQTLAEPDWADKPLQRERIITSLKFLRAILNSRLNRRLRRMNPATARQVVDREEHVRDEAQRFIDDVSPVVAYFRAIAGPLHSPDAEQTVAQDYRLTDESISLLLEESYLSAYSLVEQFVTGEERSRLHAALSRLVEQENEYRAGQGYRVRLLPNSDNEEYLFRSSALKKFTSNVLYLAASVQTEGRTLEQLLFAAAAGISMIFATVIAFYFQARFGTFTLPVFTALVVGYMFKDRIKEVGRLLSVRLLRNVLYDRRIILQTSDHRHDLGFLREKVGFVPKEELPDAVRKLRRVGLDTGLDGDGQQESVIDYTKTVTLFSQKFDRISPGGPALTGVSDILRLDIRPFLHKMADPVQRKPLLREGRVQMVRCRKVYHVHLISVIRDGNGSAPRYTASQLTLNRKGIVRVRRLSLPSPQAPER